MAEQALRKTWWVVLCVAAVQIGVAVFAVWSSERDILSDGACIGGIFGTLANVIILCGVGGAGLIFGIKSLRRGGLHPMLTPLLVLACSSGVAIPIGLSAGLRCTV